MVNKMQLFAYITAIFLFHLSFTTASPSFGSLFARQDESETSKRFAIHSPASSNERLNSGSPHTVYFTSDWRQFISIKFSLYQQKDFYELAVLKEFKVNEYPLEDSVNSFTWIPNDFHLGVEREREGNEVFNWFYIQGEVFGKYGESIKTARSVDFQIFNLKDPEELSARTVVSKPTGNVERPSNTRTTTSEVQTTSTPKASSSSSTTLSPTKNPEGNQSKAETMTSNGLGRTTIIAMSVTLAVAIPLFLLICACLYIRRRRKRRREMKRGSHGDFPVDKSRDRRRRKSEAQSHRSERRPSTSNATMGSTRDNLEDDEEKKFDSTAKVNEEEALVEKDGTLRRMYELRNGRTSGEWRTRQPESEPLTNLFYSPVDFEARVATDQRNNGRMTGLGEEEPAVHVIFVSSDSVPDHRLRPLPAPPQEVSEPILYEADPIRRKPEPLPRNPELERHEPEPLQPEPEPIRHEPDLIHHEPEAPIPQPGPIHQNTAPILYEPLPTTVHELDTEPPSSYSTSLPRRRRRRTEQLSDDDNIPVDLSSVDGEILSWYTSGIPEIGPSYRAQSPLSDVDPEVLLARKERIEREKRHIQRLMEIDREEEELRIALAERKE